MAELPSISKTCTSMCFQFWVNRISFTIGWFQSICFKGVSILVFKLDSRCLPLHHVVDRLQLFSISTKGQIIVFRKLPFYGAYSLAQVQETEGTSTQHREVIFSALVFPFYAGEQYSATGTVCHEQREMPALSAPV